MISPNRRQACELAVAQLQQAMLCAANPASTPGSRAYSPWQAAGRRRRTCWGRPRPPRQLVVGGFSRKKRHRQNLSPRPATAGHGREQQFLAPVVEHPDSRGRIEALWPVEGVVENRRRGAHVDAECAATACAPSISPPRRAHEAASIDALHRQHRCRRVGHVRHRPRRSARAGVRANSSMQLAARGGDSAHPQRVQPVCSHTSARGRCGVEARAR